MNVDGSVSIEHKRDGFVLEDPEGHQFAYAMKFTFHVSNKETEYEALLTGLQMAQSLKITYLLFRSDPQVVIG